MQMSFFLYETSKTIDEMSDKEVKFRMAFFKRHLVIKSCLNSKVSNGAK